MGVVERVLGSGAVAAMGEAAEGVSEVFVANATRAMEIEGEIHRATLEAAAAEFAHGGGGIFDRVINGINRLPRPFMALGTLGLFVYAMVDPVGFAARMVGLEEVPEPLWWLLGAIVSFYFGARELHYARAGTVFSPAPRTGPRPRRGLAARLRGLVGRRGQDGRDAALQGASRAPEVNPALSEWQTRQ